MLQAKVLHLGLEHCTINQLDMRYWILPAFILLSIGLYGQSNDLTLFNEHRLGRQRTAMLVLGGWAAGNIATGLWMRSKREGEARYFHEMNALWNGVNLGIAALGYWTAQRTAAGSLDLFSSVHEHYNFQQILLLNAGLDVGYMLGGLYLKERAKNTSNRPERLQGYGRAVLLQGGFLLAFDVANYVIQARHNHELRLLLGHTGDGIGLTYWF